MSSTYSYFFDLGVKNYLTKVHQLPFKTSLYGDAFEHFIAMELRAYLSYRRNFNELCYWRSKSGFEVDFLVGDELAIEVKASDKINANDLKGISAFQQEKIAKKHIVISHDPIDKKLSSNITLLHWQSFLSQLWNDELINQLEY